MHERVSVHERVFMSCMLEPPYPR